ncbi:uncharacterized protein V6R79_014096 [Siganus canaliculatus]
MSLTKIAHLTDEEKKRYQQKIDILGLDPYLLNDKSLIPLQSAKKLPNLTFADIYIYLVHNPSPYTGEALKAFKSTEAYRYFTSGWVKDAKLHHVADKKMFTITGKAGLGEVCSHASALMYCVLAAVDLRNGQACTQKPCAWAQPSEQSVQDVQYAEIRNINFSHKHDPHQVQSSGFTDVRPSDEECRIFFEMLHHSEMQESKPKKSAILSVIEDHSHRYTPKVMQLDLPTLLSTLYSSQCLQMDLPMLLVESTRVFDNLHLTQQQVQASGFVINPDYPWIGASPDGLVTCTCHGDGVLEIKCPFSSKDCTLTESCKDPSFCLRIEEDGTMTLKTDHKYMYQVQAQMHVARVSYCDFMVWTLQDIFIQRIKYDPVFFHNAYLKVYELIKTGILPELLGKWYTAPHHISTDTAATVQPPEMGCCCGQPSDSDDISCTSGQCKRKHFQRSFLKLKREPMQWHLLRPVRDRVASVLSRHPIHYEYLQFVCAQELQFVQAGASYMDIPESVLGSLQQLSDTVSNCLSQRVIPPLFNDIAVTELRGSVGQPQITIESQTLLDMLSTGLPLTSLSDLHGISRSTLYRRMKDNNLSVRKCYSDISDDIQQTEEQPPCAPSDEDNSEHGVVVPGIQCPLSEERLLALQQINPNAALSSFGRDIYLQAVNVASGF